MVCVCGLCVLLAESEFALDPSHVPSNAPVTEHGAKVKQATVKGCGERVHGG
jgi:hypothetical protein